MGLVGGALGGVAGGALGSAVGKKIGGKKYGGTLGKVGGDLGKIAGSAAGALLPFAKGGRVKAAVQPALLHRGEIVVPASLANQVPMNLKKMIKANGGRNM